MKEEKLTKELISDPTLWRLSMELSDDALEVAIYSVAKENSLIHRYIPLDTNLPLQKALEEAVYDNPLLLSDFDKIDMLVDTNRFMLIPDDIKSDDLREDIASTMWPDYDLMMLTNPLPGLDTTIAYEVCTPIISFIRRTFPTVRIQHRLTPLITYFYNKGRLSNSAPMYVNLRDGAIDIIHIRNGKVLIANTYAAAAPSDILYYILAAVKTIGFSVREDEIIICGAPDLREQVSKPLRKYASYVMPMVFPAVMYDTGHDAKDTPYELILIPLCE